MKTNELPSEFLHELFDYCDGELLWKVSGNGRKVGKTAGAVNRDGYKRVKINYKLYAIHRLVWIMHGNTSAPFIDHINGDQLDNRIENLRAATHSQNCMNRQVRFDSKSGVKGVTRKKNKWYGCVMVNSKRYSAGYFDHKEDAINAVAKLRKELHGEFARS